MSDIRVFDFRHRQKNPPEIWVWRKGKKVRARKHKVRKGRVVERDPRIIRGITLHQTGVPFSPKRKHLKEFEGDRLRAIAERCFDVAAHALSFEGSVVLPNPLSWYVYHGNDLSAFSLGLEVDGRFPVYERKRRERHTEFTGLRIESARRALKELYEKGLEENMPLQYLWAHRQASPSRAACPGELIFREVGLYYGRDVLGLKIQPNKRWKSKSRKAPGWGRGIPDVWLKEAV